MSTCEYKPQQIERTFESVLSFAQELIFQNGIYIPRPITDQPSTPIIGKLLIKFSKDLSAMKYRLYVYGNINLVNLNQLIIGASLNAGHTYENGPMISVLFNNPAGVQVNGLLASGILQNGNIHNVRSSSGNRYNTIASLLQGIREGDVYVNVFGTDRNPNMPGYARGLIRGQILARETE